MCKEAYEYLREQLYINHIHQDPEYDLLLHYKEMLPKYEEHLKKYLKGRELCDLLHYLTNEIELSARQYARGIRRNLPRFVNEAEVMKLIYGFSKKRGFRYGINKEYIARDLNTFEPLIEVYLNDLKKKGWVFFKNWKGNIYVLPTKKGRAEFERNTTN